MRGRIPIAAIALLSGACAGPGVDVTGTVPLFVRSWRAYTPEERNRDVVECAESARLHLTDDRERWGDSADALRRALRARTIDCMAGRGWERG